MASVETRKLAADMEEGLHPLGFAVAVSAVSHV
jgi:hypothetical protein